MFTSVCYCSTSEQSLLGTCFAFISNADIPSRVPEFAERSYLLAGTHFFVCDALAPIDLTADLTTIGVLSGSSTSGATGTSWNGPSRLQV